MPEVREEWIHDVRWPERRQLPHGTPSERRAPSTYLLTVCTRPRRLNQLCHETVAAVIHRSLEFQQGRALWRVHACVLMPDHLHLIATVAAETPLTHTVMYWKRYLAREAGVDWQRDFFEHRLRRDEHFDAKVDYLRMNPVRAGLVANPDEWPCFWTW
jgi:REP element-mobilizing transposase RayT